jgi:integrase/recombinase XerC
VGQYAAWISRTGLAASTRERYPRAVRAFLEFVAAGGDRLAGAMSNPDVRDYSVAEYRRHLLTERKLAPASVTLYLAAIALMYDSVLGLGRPDVEPVRYSRAGRHGVTDTDRLRAILRVAKRRGGRDYAIIVMFMLCGPRLGELVALDIDDVHLTASTGLIEIRHGKGGQPR